MNIPNGFKLVPVEPTEEMLDVIRAGGYSWHLYSNLLAAAPTPTQPIYDEAKERELFEATLGKLMLDRLNGGEYKNIFIEAQWLGWLACAQSRAKAVEAGDE